MALGLQTMLAPEAASEVLHRESLKTQRKAGGGGPYLKAEGCFINSFVLHILVLANTRHCFLGWESSMGEQTRPPTVAGLAT